MANFKLKGLTFLSVSLLMTVLFISATNKFGGSPGAKTGSPGDNNDNCTFCHSDNDIINNNNLISSDIPANGYVPGETYMLIIKASHTGSKRIGFEITAENNISDKIGTFALINDELTKFTNDSTAVTHTFKGTVANDSVSWQLNWQAPEPGSGDVTFYIAVNASNSDQSSSGDQVYLSNYHVIEEGTTGEKQISFVEDKIRVYPNPVKNKINISVIEPSVINNITLLNIFGKKVRSFKFDRNVKSIIQIELDKINVGIYFIVLEIDNQIIVRKIYKL